MSAEDSSSKDSAVIDDDLVEALGFEPTSTRDDISVVDDDDELEAQDDVSPERPPVARPFDADADTDTDTDTETTTDSTADEVIDRDDDAVADAGRHGARPDGIQVDDAVGPDTGVVGLVRLDAEPPEQALDTDAADDADEIDEAGDDEQVALVYDDDPDLDAPDLQASDVTADAGAEQGAAFGEDVEFVDVAETDLLDDLPEIEPEPEVSTSSYFDDLELVSLDDADAPSSARPEVDFDADEMADAFENGSDELLDFDDAELDPEVVDDAEDLEPVRLADLDDADTSHVWAEDVAPLADQTIDLTTVDLTDDDLDDESATGWADEFDDDARNSTVAATTGASLPMQGGRKTRQIRARKARRVIRHVDPWSTLTFSVLFHLCFFAAMLLSSVLVWNAAQSAGIIDNLESFIIELGDYDTFDIDGDAMFRAALLISGILTLASTVMVVLLTVVFNLISDLVGGIRVTVIEEETVRLPAGAKK